MTQRHSLRRFDDDGALDLFFLSHGGGDAIAALGDGHGGFVVGPGSYPTTEVHLSYDFDENGRPPRPGFRSTA